MNGQVLGHELQLREVPIKGRQVHPPACRTLQFSDHPFAHALFKGDTVEIPTRCAKQDQGQSCKCPAPPSASFLRIRFLRIRSRLIAHLPGLSAMGGKRRITACARRLCISEFSPSVTRCSISICWILSCT